jgi:hypothetical protein
MHYSDWQAHCLSADIADFAVSGSANDDDVAELLSRISSISLRAEDEAEKGVLSVRDLTTSIPPISSRASHSARGFSVGLHSPPSPRTELASPARNELPESKGPSAAVASSIAILAEQVQTHTHTHPPPPPPPPRARARAR